MEAVTVTLQVMPTSQKGQVLTPLHGYGQDACFVTTRTGSTLDDLLAQHLSWVQLPEPIPFARLIAQAQELTGWSFRQLAEVLGTSHTTVGKLANQGAVSARSRAAADRIEPLLDVLIRLSRVVEPGERLAAALGELAPSGDRGLDFLSSGDWARAFLAGLDAVQGPRAKRPQPMTGASKLAPTRELF